MKPISPGSGWKGGNRADLSRGVLKRKFHNRGQFNEVDGARMEGLKGQKRTWSEEEECQWEVEHLDAPWVAVKSVESWNFHECACELKYCLSYDRGADYQVARKVTPLPWNPSP